VPARNMSILVREREIVEAMTLKESRIRYSG